MQELTEEIVIAVLIPVFLITLICCACCLCFRSKQRRTDGSPQYHLFNETEERGLLAPGQHQRASGFYTGPPTYDSLVSTSPLEGAGGQNSMDPSRRAADNVNTRDAARGEAEPNTPDALIHPPTYNSLGCTTRTDRVGNHDTTGPSVTSSVDAEGAHAASGGALPGTTEVIIHPPPYDTLSCALRSQEDTSQPGESPTRDDTSHLGKSDKQ